MLGYFGLHPWVCPEPGRMYKMVKGHDGLKSILVALHQHIDVVIQRLMIERRGRAHPINVGRLYSAPFDPKTERV
jgi:hypothetical protein